MKTQIRFCKRCDDNTYHDITSGFTPEMTGLFERVFFGIGTLGFSELERDVYITCQKCNKMTVR